MNPIVKSLLKFHVYFTTRRVLFELGCPLPKSNAFSQTNNFYKKDKLEKLFNEFGLDKDSDFRFLGEPNNGVGWPYWYPGPSHGAKPDKWPSDYMKFSDEGGKASDGNLIAYMTSQDTHHGRQHKWFSLNLSDAKGITKAGYGRLNRSVEAFVYCVLGAQVNTRNSIIGGGGGAQETQQEMNNLFESAVIEEDISQSIQRYQLSVQESRLRLDLAIAPGVWLIPSTLIINKHSVMGYNNELKKATIDMKFGLNEKINSNSRKVGIDHNLGASKKNTKEERKYETPRPEVEPEHTPDIATSKPKIENAKREKPPESTSHDRNLMTLVVAGAGMAWWLFK